MRFDRLIKKNLDVLPLLESVNEGREEVKELGISHPDSEVLHGARGSSVVVLI